ncbi:MAG: phenylalanine--tRNA ligase subunit alpha [Nanoarchaeota archaeon]|nr:phenylalanine--tRNA ligase subunit alpha [Nanoarchaeota archaeon]
MELKKLIDMLDPLERKIVPLLQTEKSFPELVKKSNLQEVEVMRALQWLKNKDILEIKTDKKKVITLDQNGQKYLQEGLPEKLILNLVKEQPLTIKQLQEKSKLNPGEFNSILGILRQKVAIEIKDGKINITEQGKKFIEKESLEEKFLKKQFPLDLERLQEEEKFAFEQLKKRKNILKIEDSTERTIELTKLGQQLTQQKISDEEVLNRLTSSMLKTQSWKNKKFRHYDLQADVPQTSFGRKHFVTEAVDYIKKIWLEMGFQEMTGSLVQTAFWDLDSLFVPQDHPAREMQDTFYLQDPAQGSLPKELYPKIKAVHENGGKTGSKGWQYQFSEQESKQLLLRTHTTVLSAQTLSQLKKEDLPAKFFSVAKVFRNETLDWKHLFEFYQVEGIVVDPNANLKHLKGYLKEFYKKMGYTDVRMRPAHFPYTEPSIEVDVFHPVKKEWIELGGAGIFRPEVTQPLLGFECPVLAWGQGMGRIISEYWKIKDIRDLYKNNLKQLREIKTWLK